MPLRLKKFIGMLLLVALVVVYAIAATLFAVARLGDASSLVHFIYFLLSGLLWVLPGMVIVKWMATPSKPRERNGAR